MAYHHSSDPTTTVSAETGSTVTPNAGATTIEETLALAKRAFALKKYEEAVDRYATALELMYVALSRRTLSITSL